MASVLRNALFSLFYPHNCPTCDNYIGDLSKVVCDECLRNLPRTEQAQIQDNGTEMVLWDKADSRAAAKKTMHMERAAAYLFYEKENPIQDMIHLMKYKDQPMIGYKLGRQAAMEMQYAGFFDSIDIIVPMPLHPKRLRERGYNQSEYIAKGISDITGIPVDTTHVMRIKNTPQQALQRGEARKQNVADAFEVNHPEQMYRKHILIVDDLITTGETMRSCLRAMKRFRGATFSVFALCKAQ
ncbi:MAG: ComF family protein [Paludibacteraceae bacterium]|nr:ComF family protein [Paludibacteraceae bacterium]